MSEQQEKKNRRIALATSLGIHGGVLLLFLLLMAWRAPNPPHPEYGIELNFGLDKQGGGEIQPETNPGEQQTSDESKAEEAQQQQQDEVKPEEQKVNEKVDEPVVSKVESPVVVKEEKKEAAKEPVKEPVKDKPTEKIVKKEDVKKEEKKETNTGDSKKDEAKKGDNTTSHGDDKGKVGDKGDPEGKLDANALYGNKGGGGGGDGFGLSMSGWAWAEDPKIPNLPDNEDGRIEFEIECDEDGEIIGITTLQRGLSPRAEQLLKDEIRKNSLVRTSGGKAPDRSKGRVVFILKTK